MGVDEARITRIGRDKPNAPSEWRLEGEAGNWTLTIGPDVFHSDLHKPTFSVPTGTIGNCAFIDTIDRTGQGTERPMKASRVRYFEDVCATDPNPHFKVAVNIRPKTTSASILDGQHKVAGAMLHCANLLVELTVYTVTVAEEPALFAILNNQMTVGRNQLTTQLAQSALAGALSRESPLLKGLNVPAWAVANALADEGPLAGFINRISSDGLAVRAVMEVLASMFKVASSKGDDPRRHLKDAELPYEQRKDAVNAYLDACIVGLGESIRPHLRTRKGFRTLVGGVFPYAYRQCGADSAELAELVKPLSCDWDVFFKEIAGDPQANDAGRALLDRLEATQKKQKKAA